MEFEGIVEKVEFSESKDNKKYAKVTIGGKKFSDWATPEIWEDISPGNFVKIEYEENKVGKVTYKNIKKIIEKKVPDRQATLEKVPVTRTETIATPVIRVGRKSVISTGQYQNETFEISVMFPVDSLTEESMENVARLVEKTQAKQIKGCWAIEKISEDTRKKIEKYVEKELEK